MIQSSLKVCGTEWFFGNKHLSQETSNLLLLLLTGFSVLFKTLALPLFSSILFVHSRFQLVHPLFYLLAIYKHLIKR